MSKFNLNRLIYISQSEKAQFAMLNDVELRELAIQYRSKKDFMRASYISRPLIRRQHA